MNLSLIAFPLRNIPIFSPPALRNCHPSPLFPLCLFSCPPSLTVSLSLTPLASLGSLTHSISHTPDAPPSLICPVPQRVAEHSPSLPRFRRSVLAQCTALSCANFTPKCAQPTLELTGRTWPRGGEKFAVPRPSPSLSRSLMGVSSVHAPALLWPAARDRWADRVTPSLWSHSEHSLDTHLGSAPLCCTAKFLIAFQGLSYNFSSTSAHIMK